MGLLDALLGRDQRLGEEVRAATVGTGLRVSTPWDAVWVGDRTALSLPALFGAIDLIAGLVAATPFAARRADNTLLDPQPVVVSRPDPSQTRTEAVYDLVSRYLLRGEVFLRMYARDDAGWPTAIVMLDGVEVFRNSEGQKRYLWNGSEWTSRDIRHLKWLSLPDSEHGAGPIQLARLAIAGELASMEFTRRMFTDGGIATSVLKHPGALTPEEAASLKAAWVRALAGTREPAVLSGGIDYEVVAPNLVDMALADLRKEGVLDVCRLFRVPPSLLAAEVGGSSLTYQNVQEVWLQLLRLQQPLFAKIEAVWSEVTPPGIRVWADQDFWLRPDPRGQLDAVIAGVQGGVFTVEEARTRLGLPAEPEGMRPATGAEA